MNKRHLTDCKHLRPTANIDYIDATFAAARQKLHTTGVRNTGKQAAVCDSTAATKRQR